MSGQLYGYADVGRMGLGHGLLAYGRCVVWCHDNNAQRIAPRWLRLRIGPYLRRERDKRFYYPLFQTGAQIGGWERLRLLLTAPRFSDQTEKPPAGFSPQNDTIVVFENAQSGNEAKYFHEIAGRSAIVRPALIDMTRPRYRPAPSTCPHIALHIRGGDFQAVDVSALKSGVHNIRLPQSWYADMLSGLRAGIGQDLPAIIYSDCSDEEIAGTLMLPRVTRAPRQESITDMLAMGQAEALISSGSGFSRWSAYLGQIPRLCYPGQRVVRTLDENQALELEPECETARDIPADFCDFIRVRLAAQKPGGVAF